MSLDQQVASLVKASNDLTGAVNGKIGQIDQRVTTAKNDFDRWKDSVQAEDINGAPLYNTVVDLTGLRSDYFYPVWWVIPENNGGDSQIIISRRYSDDSGRDPFGTGGYHIAGLFLQLEGVAHPWSGDANFLHLKRLSQTYRKTVRAVNFGMKCIARPVDGSKSLYQGYKDGQIVHHSTRSGCYLRGGLSYQVDKTFDGNFWYSRKDEEVSTASSVQESFEIKWNVKSYRIDDPFLGGDYADFKYAYSYDFDNRYAKK